MLLSDNLSMKSQTCMNCKAKCGPEELYCSNCGFLLPEALGGGDRTFNIGSTQTRSIDLQWGTGYFHFRAKLFLRLESSDLTIPIPLEAQAVIVGRKADGTEPKFVDLTPFGAADLGVSRRHARIDRVQDTIQVTDLESANGTYLNRTRLLPGEAHMLRNRAVLQLGQMILRVQFA